MLFMKSSCLFLSVVLVCSVLCDVSVSQDIDDSKVKTDLEERSVQNVNAAADVKIPSTKNETASRLTRNRERSKFSQLKSNVPSDIQIPVAVIYDPPVTPTRQAKHRTRSSRYRKIRRLHDDDQFHSRAEESLAKSSEVTTFRPRKMRPNAVDVITRRASTEKMQKRTRDKDPIVPILEDVNQVYSDKGEFHYNYLSGDGTTAFERGEFKHSDSHGKLLGSVKGGFSYYDQDGNDFTLSYTADENGYHPVGAHLPTPPPIPPAIARALKYLATKPAEEHVTYSYIDY